MSDSGSSSSLSNDAEELERNLFRLQLEDRLKKPSRLEKLEQEMKLLQWHKLANEAALKAAIIRNRQLKKRVQERKALQRRQAKRNAWIHDIIADEKRRRKDYLTRTSLCFGSRYEKSSLEKEREESQLKMLRHVKKKIYEREVIRRRNQRYRKRKQRIKILRTSKLRTTSIENENASGLLLEDQKDKLTKENNYRRYMNMPPKVDSLEGKKTLETINKLMLLESKLRGSNKDVKRFSELPELQPQYSHLFESKSSSFELPKKYTKTKGIYAEETEQEPKIKYLDEKLTKHEKVIKQRLKRRVNSTNNRRPYSSPRLKHKMRSSLYDDKVKVNTYRKHEHHQELLHDDKNSNTTNVLPDLTPRTKSW